LFRCFKPLPKQTELFRNKPKTPKYVGEQVIISEEKVLYWIRRRTRKHETNHGTKQETK
jgi:hypothetical protein